MGFKHKKKKKIEVDKNSLATVENVHTKIVNEIQEKNENIPKLHEKINILKEKRKNSTEKKERILIEKQIREIKSEIKNNNSLKNNYYHDNLKFLFNYFEEKKKINDSTHSKKKIINSFFFKETKDKKNYDNENNITNQYLRNVNYKSLNINSYIVNSDMCDCKGELIYVEHEGVQVCNICGKINSHIIDHDKPSYRDPPQEVSFYAYKRINHFREILAQFQAKETTDIPDEIIQNIKHQIKKERISLDELTNSKSKDILKKLGYNKYYEHIPFIKDKLGIKPPVMSQELETKLCNLFMEIEKQYSKHCPNNRVNFLNYYYVLFKLCELLKEKKFLPYFPMLKDQTKRIEQDVIWKKICKELNWTFYPTI